MWGNTPYFHTLPACHKIMSPCFADNLVANHPTRYFRQPITGEHWQMFQVSVLDHNFFFFFKFVHFIVFDLLKIMLVQ